MRVLIGLVCVVVLLVGGLLVAPSFINWDKYKDQGLAQVKTLTGYDITIDGEFALAFLPSPHVKAQGVNVVNPAASNLPLASFDALSVSIALAPLLKGAVQVSEISLKKPDFDIRLDKNGKGNWLSPEVEALMAGKGEEDKGVSDGGKSPEVSFDRIRIEQGAFRFTDSAKGSVTEIEDIDLLLKAESLQGPFDADGAIMFGGQGVQFSAKTSVIDTQAGGLSLNLKVEQGDYKVDYSGALSFAEPLEAQGEIVLSAATLPGLGQGASLKGFMSAGLEKAAFKDSVLQIGEQSYTGSLSVALKPAVKVVADFDGKGILDIDALLPKKSTQETSGEVSAILDILPNEVSLPKAFEADVKFGSAGIIYNKALIKNVDIALSKSGKAFKANVKADDIPGRGPAAIDVDLAFAERSVSKTGVEVYSQPKLNALIQANTQNTGETIKAFTGKDDFPVLSDARIGKFYIKAEAAPGRVGLGESIINLDDLKLQVSGSMKRGKGNPLVSAKVSANEVNFDTLLPKKPAGAAAKEGAPTDALQSLSLPVDVDFDVSVNKAVMNGQGITGLKVAGALRPDTLKLSRLAAQDFGGASFDVAGKIGSLKALSGLDFTVKGAADDPYKVAKTFNVDASKLPKDLGAVKVSSKVSGSLTALDTNTNVNAFGGEFIVQGAVANPLTALSFSDLAVQIKHQNLSKLLSNVGASAPEYKAFSKPIDFYALLDMNGKVTTLSGIKATVAGASMSGNVRFDGSAAKPAISGGLKFGRLELVSSGGGKGGSQKSSGGKWDASPIDSGFLHAVNANFDVSADSILYEKWDMKAPSLKMVLNNGALDVQNLKGALFDGQIAVTAKVSSASPSAPVALSTDASITDVNLEQLVFALSGSKRVKAQGKGSLSLKVAGTGASQKAIVSGLGGDATLSGRNIVMQGFDLAAVTNAVENDNRESILGAVRSFSSGSTSFDTVDGAYTITNGLVSIGSMAMRGPAASIASTGSVSLPAWTMDTKHTVSFNQTDKLDPFSFTIRGPIDRPINSFTNIGRDLLQGQAQKFIQKQLQKQLSGTGVGDALQQFGILGGGQEQPANDNAAPSTGGSDATTNGAPPAQQQQQQPQSVEDAAQDALQGVLKGLLR